MSVTPGESGDKETYLKTNPKRVESFIRGLRHLFIRQGKYKKVKHQIGTVLIQCLKKPYF